MKVLTLTNMYPTAAEPWFGSFVACEVDDLRSLGLEVDVMHFDARRDRREYGRAILRVHRYARNNQIDLIHAHYGLTGLVASTQRKVPVVTTFHGSDVYEPWQRVVAAYVARRTVPVFVAAPMKRQLRTSGGYVIGSPVDLSLFEPSDRAEARRRLGWQQDGTYVLLPGARTNPVKGAALFDAVVERLRASNPTAGPIRSVSLEGFSRAEAALAMNAVDVTLMTSRTEGAPVAVKESLACLTPVVSVSVGDVPVILDGLPGCAVAPRDPDLLAQAVRDALAAGRPPELRDRVRTYSRSAIALQLLSLYEDVLREG